METKAIVLQEPEHLLLTQLPLTAAGENDAIVDIEWSGISTGTERLLWSGRMPHFPGMGYPLVPGYESVGRVVEAGDASIRPGQRVFVPGAQCFGEVRGLFGAAAARLVVPAGRLVAVDEKLGERATLLALAATAYHALTVPGAVNPDRIIGHGVLGRLLARLSIAMGGEPPVVLERNPGRAAGAVGYQVLAPADDDRRDCKVIYDASGDASLLDALIARLAPGGEIVLAGFYSKPLSFQFAPAFMREAQIRTAAEWKPADMLAVRELAESGFLPLDGLISHRAEAGDAERAYRTAFGDTGCLKMVLDWRGRA
jgi:3-hydroxyethyl bacteriochlorophyllide a dehydrogenase